MKTAGNALSQKLGFRMYAALACSALLVTGWIVLARRRASFQALPTASQDIVDVVESGDASRLMTYVPDEERAATHLDTATMEHLVYDYWRPIFANSERAKADLKIPSRGNGTYIRVRFFTRPDGFTSTFGPDVVLTPDGVKCPGIVNDLISSALIHRYMRPGEDQKLAYLRGIEADHNQLISLGISGQYDNQEHRVIPWREIESRLAKYAQRHGTPPVSTSVQ